MKWKEFTSYQLQLYPENKNIRFDLAYADRTVYVNGEPANTIQKGDGIYWNQLSQGRNGKLLSLNGSRLLAGIVTEGAETIHFKASCNLSYVLKFTGVNDAQEFELRWDSRLENGDLIEMIELTLKDSDTNLAYCCLHEGQQDPDGHDYLHVHGNVLPGVEDYLGFGFFDVKVSEDLMGITGNAWKNEEDSFTEKPVMDITGSYKMNEEYQQRMCRIKNSKKTDAESEQIEPKQIQRLDEEKPLYVESLYSVPIPNVEAVNNDFSAYVHNLMLYCITDAQLEYIGSPERPTEGNGLSAEMIKFVEENEDVRKLMTEHYYYACLSSILGSGDYEYSDLIKDIDHYEERLDGYYSGDEETSLCNEPAYQKIADKFYAIVYFQTVPEVKAYLGEAQRWAQHLHDYALYLENARQMADEYSHNIQSRLQHIVILLNYLNSKKVVEMKCKQISGLCAAQTAKEPQSYKLSLGSDVYYQLLNRSIMDKAMTTTYNDLIMDEEQRKAYYEKGAKVLIERIYDESQPPLLEWQELKDEIDEALEHKIIAEPGEYYAPILSLLLEFESFVSASADCAMSPKLNEFYKKCPKSRWVLCKTAFLLTQGLMIWNSLSMLLDWDKLSREQQASAVSNFCYTLTDLCSNLCQDFSKCFSKKNGGEAAAEISTHSSSVKATQGLEAGELETVVNKGRGFFTEMMETTQSLSKIEKVLGGLMSAFAFITCVCDIINDVAKYGDDAYLMALNVITGIANGIAMVAAAGFTFISVCCAQIIGSCAFVSLLPGIGWICTVAGILLSFITYFVRRFACKTKEQKYIEQNCVPFVESLVIPEEEVTRSWEMKKEDYFHLELLPC